MKKVALFLLLLFSTFSAHAIVLKPVNIPKNWSIESTEKEESVEVGEVTVPLMIKQSLQGSSPITIHYYACPNANLRLQVFDFFFKQNKSVFQDQKMVYLVEAQGSDFKNTLRFLEIPLKEQIKVLQPEIKELEAGNLTAENWMEQDEVEEMGNFAGVVALEGLTQMFEFPDSKAKLRVRYLFCKNRHEALTGYKNVRIKQNSKLISYAFAQQFLIELAWVQ